MGDYDNIFNVDKKEEEKKTSESEYAKTKIKTPPKVKPLSLFENTDLPDIVELKDIRQVYPMPDGSEKVVIDHMDMLIEDHPGRGQFVVILGSSGCGKSTVLRYIAGLQEPTEGEVKIHSKPRTDKDRIGMVFQKYSSLGHYTVEENVGLGLEFAGVAKDEIKERVSKMLEVVGLDGHGHKYAQYPILSGGQLQRVAIARNLVCNSEIILMDEPFGALDIKTRHDMQDFLINIWEEFQNTIMLVTHDISEAVYLADEIWIMRANPGHVVDRIKIELPDVRRKELKRDKRFMDYVHQIEDRMFEVDEMSKQKK